MRPAYQATRGLVVVACVLGIGALVLGAIGACTVGPDYAPSKLALPAGWSQSPVPTSATQPAALSATASAGSAATRPAEDLSQWWRCFNDETLDRLVSAATKSNYDLRMAQERLVESRALRKAADAGRWPQVNASGSYARVRNSQTLFDSGGAPGGTSDGGGSGGTGGGAFNSDDHDFFRAGFDAAWEADIFGGVRRSIEAADAHDQAAIEDERAILVSLLAEVAQQYIDLRAMQARLRVVQRNVEAQRDNVAVTAARFGAGLTTELDVAQAQAQLATTQSLLPELEAAGQLSLHRMAMLLGQTPPALGAPLPTDATPAQRVLRDLAHRLDVVAGTPATQPSDSITIPRGPAPALNVPSGLLARRPDLRRAERELAAATAQIGVAKAELYPKLFLVGSFGHESISASDFFDGASRYWSIGPTLRWSLFSAGRLRARVDAQDSRARQAALRYEQAALTAVKEVEDALTGQAREHDKHVMLQRAVDANRRAVAIAEEQYTRGLIGFLPVLVARTALYRSEDDLTVGERNLSQSVVATYKALGGGWDFESAAALHAETRARTAATGSRQSGVTITHP